MTTKTDLHLHTTASDGSDTPSELVAKAKARGIEVIAITDHDTLVGSKEAIALPDAGVKVITGIEFSCHHWGNATLTVIYSATASTPRRHLSLMP